MDAYVGVMIAAVSLISIIATLITALNSVRKDAFSNLEVFTKKLEARLVVAEAERDAFQKEWSSLMSRLVDYEKQLGEYKTQVLSLTEKNKDLEALNKNLEAEINALRLRVNELTSKTQ
jgi:peptidoglycan hydrolase CwlO-like protein